MPTKNKNFSPLKNVFCPYCGKLLATDLTFCGSRYLPWVASAECTNQECPFVIEKPRLCPVTFVGCNLTPEGANIRLLANIEKEADRLASEKKQF